MDLKEIGWGNVNWIHLAQYRVQHRTVTNMAVSLSGFVKSASVEGLLASSEASAALTQFRICAVNICTTAVSFGSIPWRRMELK
jgi:hypothetical protein